VVVTDPPTSGARPTVGIVVVDHDAGDVLGDCLASMAGEAVDEVVVVDNGGTIGSAAEVVGAPAEIAARVQLVRTGANLGYGAGVNRGVAATSAEVIVVTNPDVVLRRGAVTALVAAVQGDPTVAVVGPCIFEISGRRYPSARRFPSSTDAVGHALFGRWWPTNQWSRRYRMDDLDPDRPCAVDWVSGACFAVRRQAWEELGGFDESYFMYAEDMDLCFRAGQAGWSVRYEPAAAVTHVQGVSTRKRPYVMALAHHRSALRFAWRTNHGWRRLLIPAAAVLLAGRLVTEVARVSWQRSATGRSRGARGSPAGTVSSIDPPYRLG